MKLKRSGNANTLLNTSVVGEPYQKNYELGLGVDALTGQIRASAVKAFQIKRKPAKTPEFIYTLVSSQSDLESLIEGSLSASYNLEGVKISASASFLNSISVSELSVTLVASISVEESEYALAPHYEMSVVPDADFRKKYGDYFVAGHLSGSHFFAVYQCHFKNTQQRTEFAASLGAEMPEVFSVEGKIRFEEMVKQNDARLTIRITASGTKTLPPAPPAEGWNPSNINSILIPWYYESMTLVPLKSYLRHYCIVDPSISAEVPIDPDVFFKLSFMYNRFWLSRSLYFSCPEFGRKLIEEPYARLLSELEARQSILTTNPEYIDQITNEIQEILNLLRQVNSRQLFFTQVVKAGKLEPPKGQRFDADGGVLRYTYGYQASTLPGVVISSNTETVKADYKIGWNDHVFVFQDDLKIIVGWDLLCNRSDGWNGDWHKVSDQIIGRSKGEVYVKGDYDREYDWTITWYYVDAHFYPLGPWHEGGEELTDFDMTINTEASLLDAYWTVERMQSADPVDRSFVTENMDADSLKVKLTAKSRGGGTVSSDAVSLYSDPQTSIVANPEEFPKRVVGRLFYSVDGQPRWASAAVVNNKGILTAAHCILFDGKKAENIRFIPAYTDGAAPYGSWDIDQCFWPNAWAKNQVTAWDVAFCTIRPNPLSNKNIGDVTGFAGMRWGISTECWVNVGYPAQPIPGYDFNGKHMWQCRGSKIASVEASTVVKKGNLTAGGSGGPWFMVCGDQRIINGVFSKYFIDQQINTSPEFLPWVGEFFNHVFKG